MALLTDDQDIRDVRLFMEIGGNGDYYLNLMEMERDIFDKDGTLIQANVLISMRISTSGGNAPHEVKMAIGELYRAMRMHNLNEHPLDEESSKKPQV